MRVMRSTEQTIPLLSLLGAVLFMVKILADQEETFFTFIAFGFLFMAASAIISIALAIFIAEYTRSDN